MPFDELRRPLLLLALGAAVLVVLVDLGSAARLLGHVGVSDVPDARPGYGIAYLICIDALLLYALGLITASLFLSREAMGRLQGVAGIVASVIALIGFFLMFMFVLQLLILMVSLLLAPIFGTIAYFALFAHFDKTAAAGTLALLLVLKLIIAISLVLAQQRFLENKSLVTLVALSIGCTMLIIFLQAFPPGFLISITDSLAAVIIAALGIAWSSVLLIGSIIATVKAV